LHCFFALSLAHIYGKSVPNVGANIQLFFEFTKFISSFQKAIGIGVKQAMLSTTSSIILKR